MDTKTIWGNSRRPFSFSMLCVFSWGLLCHAYAYFHDFFSHDSLNALVATTVEERWKVELGRFLVPVYRAVTRGEIAVPWLIGVLSLLWLGLSVYLTARIFKVRSQIGVFLLAGIMTTNATVAALTATYIYELDFDMLSVLFAVMAVFFWKTKKNGFLWGSLCIAASLGIYQCNVSVAITFIMMDCILSCLQGEKAPAVFKRGLLSICMLLIGAALYYVALHTTLFLTKIKLSQGYNSISNIFKPKTDSVKGLLWGSYSFVINQFLSPKYTPSYPTGLITILLGVITFLCAVRLTVRNGISASGVLLAGTLTVLLPLGSNIAFILNDGIIHDLMQYASWMYLAFPLFLLKEVVPGDKPGRVMTFVQCGTALLTTLLIFSNCVSANALYLKKDLEQDATHSIMTRVVYDIGRIDGYEEGVTEVCFVGVPNGRRALPGFEGLSQYTGATSSNSMGGDSISYHYNTYRAYFQYNLNIPIRLCDDEISKQLKASSAVKKMPAYPADGSMRWIGGVLVIKMS